MYGVVSVWTEGIEWYETLQDAFNNAISGDTIIKKIEEVK